MSNLPSKSKTNNVRDKIEGENERITGVRAFEKYLNAYVSLTYVYGIGLAASKKILAAAGISEDVRVRDPLHQIKKISS